MKVSACGEEFELNDDIVDFYKQYTEDEVDELLVKACFFAYFHEPDEVVMKRPKAEICAAIEDCLIATVEGICGISYNKKI